MFHYINFVTYLAESGQIDGETAMLILLLLDD